MNFNDIDPELTIHGRLRLLGVEPDLLQQLVDVRGRGAFLCLSGTLNGIALPLVPTETNRATPSGVSEVPSPSRCRHAAGSAPKRKSAPSRHMRCRITASLRAEAEKASIRWIDSPLNATRARAMPRRLAICIPHARRRDHFPLRTSSV